VVVFNSLSHDRHELATVALSEQVGAAVGPNGVVTPVHRDAEGRVQFMADVPACGFAVYDLVEGPPAEQPGTPQVTASAAHLENEHLRVEVDGDGLLTSIFDKEAGREVLEPRSRGNVFQLHPDYPNFYDAWDVDRFAFDQVEEPFELESVEVVASGPLVAGLRMIRSNGTSRIEQLVALRHDARYLDFETNVDWHEDNRLLKVAFPVAVRSPRATYEIQFGHVERPTHANTSWDLARFEVCAHKWADLSEPGYGVALLNDAKYGYDIRGNVLRLSLLRAPTWPDPEADRGHHKFTYRLLPHAGDLREAGVIDAAYDLNVPLCTVAEPPHPGRLGMRHSFLSVSAPNAVVEAVKLADDGSLVVRLYEAWGRRGPVTVRAPWPVVRATVTDLLERPIDEAESTGSDVALDLEPFKIVTLKLARG
jgi:alpha-mannosidase